VTPYSKVKSVQQIAMSRVRPISAQEQELIMGATQLVQNFEKETQQFLEYDWQRFLQKMKEMDINWLGNLDVGF